MSDTTLVYSEKFNVSIPPEVEVIQVIHTSLLRRGEGKEGDPIRRIDQYWDFEGNLLWEVDPCPTKKKRVIAKRKKK